MNSSRDRPAKQASAGQAPSEANFFIGTPAGWKLPTTAWGDPDLQGTWPISYVGSVPFERCAGGRRPRSRRHAPPPCDPQKAFLTEDEFKARVAAAAGRADRYADAIKAGDFGSAFQSGIVDPTVPQRQTSLIVDPPNGRLPEMTDEGKRLSSLMKSSWALPGEQQVFESELDFDTWDRCITRGMPASMFPFRYNNGVQIIQSPGYVVLNMEMIHEARVIPIGGRPRRLRRQAVAGRVARTLGRRDARDRDDQLSRPERRRPTSASRARRREIGSRRANG